MKKVEEKNDNVSKEKKDKSRIKTYFVLILCIFIIALACVLGWFIKPGNSSNKQKESTKNNVKLKHTESVTVKSDGVYITDVSEIVDKVMPSIVSITSKTVVNSGRFGYSYFGNGSYTTEGAGSGVIVAEDDNEIYILTNYHVVEDSDELIVKFIDDESIDATIKGVSERKDIAIVAVKKKDMKESTANTIKIAILGNSDELKVGNGIIAIGNALGYGQSVTTGVVSALNREVSTDNYVQEMIQIDAAINGGNSGGALLNSKGEVVGINTAKYSSNSSVSRTSVEGMGFAIPISDVESIIESLINGKNDDEGIMLGIEGYMTDSGEIANYNLPDGLYVSSIIKDSNADKSELEIGNIITEIDGTKVTSIDTIRKVLNKKQKGDKVKLKVKYVNRNQYDEKEIEITLN